jgi:tetratricopeptide (TPR) repeat protein
MPIRALSLLMVLLWWAVAQAEKPGEADYRAGARSYAIGEYGPALELFKSAYKASGRPALLFNIAQCQKKLGQKAEAAATFRNYLQLLPEAADRVEVESTIAALERAVEQERRAEAERAANAQKQQQQEPPPPPPPKEAIAPPPVVSPPPADHKPAARPLYKQPWLWAVVGGVVVVGAAVGIGLALAPSGDAPIPDPLRYNVSFQ